MFDNQAHFYQMIYRMKYENHICVVLYFVINILKSVQIVYKISFELLHLIVFALDILIHDSFARSLYTITDWGSLEITR